MDGKDRLMEIFSCAVCRLKLNLFRARVTELKNRFLLGSISGGKWHFLSVMLSDRLLIKIEKQSKKVICFVCFERRRRLNLF